MLLLFVVALLVVMRAYSHKKRDEIDHAVRQ